MSPSQELAHLWWQKKASSGADSVSRALLAACSESVSPNSQDQSPVANTSDPKNDDVECGLGSSQDGDRGRFVDPSLPKHAREAASDRPHENKRQQRQRPPAKGHRPHK